MTNYTPENTKNQYQLSSISKTIIATAQRTRKGVFVLCGCAMMTSVSVNLQAVNSSPPSRHFQRSKQRMQHKQSNHHSNTVRYNFAWAHDVCESSRALIGQLIAHFCSLHIPIVPSFIVEKGKSKKEIVSVHATALEWIHKLNQSQGSYDATPVLELLKCECVACVSTFKIAD